MVTEVHKQSDKNVSERLYFLNNFSTMNLLSDTLQEKQFKFVVVGEPACGKSSFVLRYCHDEFTRQYYPTVGVDVFLKRTLVDNQSVRLVIWDVSGNTMTSALLDNYLYNAQVVILIYDITNNSSFTALFEWYRAITNASLQSSQKPLICLVANKCDIEHQRAVPQEKHNKFVSENQIMGHNVSTRTGENVALSFQKIIALLLGIKLSKTDLEAHQKVIKAEVFMNQTHQVVTSYQTPSSICRLQ